MSASPPMSPRKTSLDEQPLLPVYEQFQSTDTATSETPPEETATPDQIRDFLVHLLTSKRNLPLDHARRIASKWTIGTGKELRSYPPAMYLDIFGREDGWVVYKEAKLCIMLDKKSKAKETPLWARCAVQATLLAALGGDLWLFYWGIIESIMWAVACSFIMFFPAFFLTIGCAAAFFESSDPEAKIESELQECVKKCGPQQT